MDRFQVDLTPFGPMILDTKQPHGQDDVPRYVEQGSLPSALVALTLAAARSRVWS